MAHKFGHTNSLEQNKGLLMQISIIASLLIVLLIFENKTTSAEYYPNSFIEIDLEIEQILHHNNIIPPIPDANNGKSIINSKSKTEAEFSGGKEAIKAYFEKEMQYPLPAKMNDIQGRVIVSFTIDESGKIKEAKVIRSIHPLIDTEALRLINTMPTWEPATINAIPIKSKQTLPVIFINI